MHNNKRFYKWMIQFIRTCRELNYIQKISDLKPLDFYRKTYFDNLYRVKSAIIEEYQN